MQKTNQPRVSVIIPCYNHARYLPEAVASVVGQTFHDWEIVIVDDGSDDDTVLVAQALIRRYAARPIRLISHANRGQGASRNAAIATTQAPYILPLDADDLIAAPMLERTVAALEHDARLGFVSTDVRFFGAEHGSWSGGAPSRQRLLYDCRLTVTTLFRRSAWAEAGGFHEGRDLQGYEDWDFWLRLVERGWAGRLLPEPFVWYRRLPGGTLNRVQRNDLVLRARLIRSHPQLYPPSLRRWSHALLGAADRRDPARQPGAAERLLWWRWFGWYAALVARHAPRELPKTLLRPVFKQLGPRPQMYARRLAQQLKLSRAARQAPQVQILR